MPGHLPGFLFQEEESQKKRPGLYCTALLKNYCLGLFKDKEEMKVIQNSCAKVFSTQRMFMIIPKYHGGPMSQCMVLDLCFIFSWYKIAFSSITSAQPIGF